MKKNSLKINEDKTEFFIFHRNNELIKSYSLQVGDNTILLSNSTKILGVSFDQKVTLNQHVTNTCKSAYFQIRRINSIRQDLTDNAVKTLTQSVVISRLDYCNSVWCIGLPMKSIHRLQLAQNAAAGVLKERLNVNIWHPFYETCTGFQSLNVCNIRSCYSCSNPSIVKHLLMYVTY